MAVVPKTVGVYRSSYRGKLSKLYTLSLGVFCFVKGHGKDMYSSEKIFVMKFLAGLRKLGVIQIPYDNDEFYSGAEQMQHYFFTHRDILGGHANELAMLFLKKPLGGIYSEFRESIARQNGILMSFENPYYVNARIKLSNEGADFILQQDNLDISENQVLEFSKAFCDGAGIDYMHN